MMDRAARPHKILIIDDDKYWRKTIRRFAQLLRYDSKTVEGYEDAGAELRQAEEEGCPFSVATIDMGFEVGEQKMMSPLGKEILRYIKSEHPYVACIMVSGSGVAAHEILDLRDDYGLDYYVSKARLDRDMLDRAITRATGRVRPLGNIERRLEMLKQTLEICKDICVQYAYDLAIVEQRKAEKGVDVSVDVENQIVAYRARLEEAREKVQETEEEIREIEKEIGCLKEN
jgi:ActR/RegA family two-component response regulator